MSLAQTNNYFFDLLPEKDFIPVLQEFKRVVKPRKQIVLVNMTKGQHFCQRFWESVYHVNRKLKDLMTNGARGNGGRKVEK